MDYGKFFYDEVHGAQINKLMWFAASKQYSSTFEFLENLLDMDVDLSDFFGIDVDDYFDELSDRNHFEDALNTLGVNGWGAECVIPIRSDMVFNNDWELQSGSISYGHCRMFYVYADNIADFANKIKEKAEEEYNDMVDKERKRQQKAKEGK